MPKYKSGLIRYIIKLMPGKEGQLRPAGLAQHWLKPGHSFEVFKEKKQNKKKPLIKSLRHVQLLTKSVDKAGLISSNLQPLLAFLW